MLQEARHVTRGELSLRPSTAAPNKANKEYNEYWRVERERERVIVHLMSRANSLLAARRRLCPAQTASATCHTDLAALPASHVFPLSQMVADAARITQLN